MNTEIFDLGKIGITLGGEYDNKVIYEKLTIVLYKGKSYISTKTTQGVSPEQDTLIWQLVAEAKDAYHMLVDAGKTTLTEEEFLKQLEDATKGRYIVQGNIINAADEEDLTVEHSDILGIDTLKLANRPNTDGMGYVILRKNKSFASQVTKENTIYEVRYDFDLNGEEIILPNNCILKFEGGSISNGSLIGQNTLIKSVPYPIFKNIKDISGTWDISEAYPEWFDYESDVDKINSALHYFYNVKLSNKQYIIDKADENGNAIILEQNRVLKGIRIYENTSGAQSLLKINSGIYFESIVYFNKCCLIEDISIAGNGKEYTKACVKSSKDSVSRCTLNRIAVSSSHYGFDLQMYLSKITQCTANYNNVGFYIHGSVTGFEGTVNVSYTSLNISTCYAIDSALYGYYLLGIVYSTLISCAADGCGIDRNNPLSSSSSIGYAYAFLTCRGLTINSCGLEKGLRAIYINLSYSIIFNSCNFFFSIPSGVTIDDSFNFKDIIVLRWCKAIKIDRPVITYSSYLREKVTDTSQLIKLYSSPTEAILCDYINGFTEPILKYTNFYTEGGVTLESLRYILTDKNLSPISINHFINIHPYLVSNKEFPHKLSFVVENPTIKSNNSILSYSNIVEIDGNNQRIDFIGGIEFDGGGTFIIKNLTTGIHSSISSINELFTIKNGTKVLFKNCSFLINVTNISNYFINLINGDCSLEDCIIYCPVELKYKFSQKTLNFKGNIYSYIDILNNTKLALPYGFYYDNKKNIYIGNEDYKTFKNLNNKVTSDFLVNTQFIQLSASGILDYCEFLDITNNIPYIILNKILIPKKGISDNRPTTKMTNIGAGYEGFEYFDTTINKPIYWNGSKWVDATGTEV